MSTYFRNLRHALRDLGRALAGRYQRYEHDIGLEAEFGHDDDDDFISAQDWKSEDRETRLRAIRALKSQFSREDAVSSQAR